MSIHRHKKCHPSVVWEGIVAQLVLASSASVCAETVVISHVDAANPVTEGWDSYVGSTTRVMPLRGDGSESWQILDPSGIDDSVAVYFTSLSPCTIERANTWGWTLRTCLRVTEFSGLGKQSVFANFNNGERRFDMWFDDVGFADVDIVTLMLSLGDCIISGNVAFAAGIGFCGASGFRQFELIYDPALNLADLYVDGVLAVEGYPGHTIGVEQGQQGLAWGAGSTCGDGVGDFKLVEFVINCPFVAADLNQDFKVDGADLGVLLSAWGSRDCVADLDDDGSVSGSDLGLLLAAWTG